MSQPEISGALNGADLQFASQLLSAEILGSYSKFLLLNATGMVPQSSILRTLNHMENSSKENTYRDTIKDYYVRYFVVSLSISDLARNYVGTHASVNQRIIDAASGEPLYLNRPRIIRPQNDEWVREKKILSGSDGIRNMTQRELAEKYTRYPIKLREVLKFFGNPRSWPMDDFGTKQYHEDDPKYPALIPLFHLWFDNPPENAQQFYDDYNERYEPHASDIYHGKRKLKDIFTPEELQFAFESWVLVDFVDGMMYRSFQLPRTSFAMIAPLFPYEAIKRRYGYRIESWLQFGPNDELLDLLPKNIQVI